MSDFFKNSDLSRGEADNIVSDTLKKCDDGELYLENSKSGETELGIIRLTVEAVESDDVTVRKVSDSTECSFEFDTSCRSNLVNTKSFHNVDIRIVFF